MTTTHYLACDIGTENGRVILGSLTKGQLSLQEIHHFPIRVTMAGGRRGWDLPALVKEIYAGIEKAAKLNLPIAGLSANSGGGDDGASRFLPIADYLNTRLSGVAACEESLASTTRLYNPKTHDWSSKMTDTIAMPDSATPRLVPSGTTLGPLVDELRRSPALFNTRVVATCSHDKAAAIAAIPARAEQDWAYIHSDTWSQCGVELAAPITNSRAFGDGFTNEVGLGGSIHFLKNSAGLGIVHECQRAWAVAGFDYTEAQLMQLAREAGPAQAHISPADPRFRETGDMPARIAEYCRETGQPVPVQPGEVVRVVLESLALGHAETLRQLEALTKSEFDVLHIVGRGAQNEFLNQLIADATGIPVIAGPAEAAAIGNILVQALALWHLKSPDHLRGIVASSFPTQIVKPGHAIERKVRDKFRTLLQRTVQSASLAA